MRIFLPTKRSGEPKTGKGFFCLRLGKILSSLGHELIENPEIPHDVSLHLAKIRRKSGGGKKILRLNGVCHNNDLNIKSQNKGLVKALRCADGVIYQSQFSKSLCDRYLGTFDGPNTIIYNGADPDFYTNIKPAELKNKNNFISASRWRPHKRLRDIIESFRQATIEDSCLYIAGDLSKSGLTKNEIHKYFAADDLVHLGRIDQKTLGSYLKSSRAFIHLCWFDNCPNAVVEAICAGVPVISNNVGGTPEIVDPSGGFVLKIDKSYNLKPVRLYRPSAIDRSLIVQAMLSCLKLVNIKTSHVNIHNVAKLYSDFFKGVVDG